jgi:hypothetical protein
MLRSDSISCPLAGMACSHGTASSVRNQAKPTLGGRIMAADEMGDIH